MSLYRRVIALCTCLLLLAAAFSALAEETDPVMTAEEAEAAGIEVEGIATEDENETAVADAEDQPASIEGLTPLYTTEIKPFVASGKAIRMRALQDGESDVVCVIDAGETITVYAVYPSYVLAEYNGYVGYIIRTWVDENMTTLDPENTPPYGVVTSKYVATLTETANIYAEPSLSAEINDIRRRQQNRHFGLRGRFCQGSGVAQLWVHRRARADRPGDGGPGRRAHER